LTRFKRPLGWPTGGNCLFFSRAKVDVNFVFKKAILVRKDHTTAATEVGWFICLFDCFKRNMKRVLYLFFKIFLSL
jgi:hypothetical protein